MIPWRIPIVLLGAAISAMAALGCVPLNSGQSIRIFPGPGHPACVAAMVPPGQSGQFAAEQPVDVRLRVTGPVEFSVDGFDFGPETATLEASGAWIIWIETISPTSGINVSLKSFSAETSAAWRQAEELATVSRRTRKTEDIGLSLDAWRVVGDAFAVARTYIKLGNTARDRDDVRGESRAYESALGACESIANSRCSAEAANNSGLAALRLGDFDLALDRLRQALADWKIVVNPEYEAITLSNLGLLYSQAGDYQQAIAWYDQAGALLRNHNTVSRALVQNNLGVCYQSLADYDQARSHFERALSQFVALKSPRNVVLARLNLGHTSLLTGDNGRADRLLGQALAEATAGSYAALRANILNKFGQIQLAEKRLADARQTFFIALDLHRKLGDRRLEASDLYYLGVTATRAGDPATAREYLAGALEIRRAGGLREDAVDSLIALADLETAEAHPAEARQFADEGLAALESMRGRIPTAELRATYYARERHLFDLLITMADSAEASLLAAELGHGRALLDLLAEPFAGRIPGDLAQRRADGQRRIDLLATRLSTAPLEQVADIRARIGLLIAEDSEIAADIRQRVSQEKLSRPLASIEELQHTLLPPDTALVEYYLGEKQSWLWIVSKTEIRRFNLPGNAAIEAQTAPVLALFSDILNRQRDPDRQKRFEAAIRRLSTSLLGPLRGIPLPSRLILVPDGILTRVPFAALSDYGDRPLGLVHDLVQVSSAAYLAAGRAPRKFSEFPRAFLAVADPVFSADDPRAHRPSAAPGIPLARLLFTSELDVVDALIPASRRRLLRGFDANLDALDRTPLEDFAVLHFSTHALIDDRIPELSRIALSMVDPAGHRVNGFLRPSRFSGFHLDGSLVVLSACETALGKQVFGEGLLGLTASLFQAGAAQLVLTLSDVDAEGSSAFFAETYRSFFGPRAAGIEHAMRLARQALAASSRWSDPYYWAPFAVYGRPSGSDPSLPL